MERADGGAAKSWEFEVTSRQCLRQLLAEKRDALAPEDLLPPGSCQPVGPRRGRRQHGVSQRQVAEAIKVSERTYGDFERGLTVPTVEFLEKVAVKLRMNDGERFALFAYALRRDPPIRHDTSSSPLLSEAWIRALANTSGQPIYIGDIAWNILACNSDFKSIFPRVIGRPQHRLPESNLMRWILLSTAAREHHLVDWERSWARPFAAKLRMSVAAYPESQDLRALDRAASSDPIVGAIYRERGLPYGGVDAGALPIRSYRSARGNRCCNRHDRSELTTAALCTAQLAGARGTHLGFIVFDEGENTSGT
ncbi:helix-turn-helix domain-containing protein [Streptomyces sp. 8L]|uniref:helix-turn-helix domain-containing protein n=1 Tax=Streptomyces sp. 8L TaxID=2877242 RepID=UPI001CD7A6D3|nr:helix-turn-helix domain-containing protein [Streptomyces sp. 8L]MCA1217356.1 helix-turn-helix domain-containing protein [Streptomyces sp. 8L]